MYSKRLKEIRVENKLTQKKLAEVLNIAEITYTHYESEYYILPTKYLIDLSNYFNVSIDYLFNFTNQKQYQEYTFDIDTNIAGLRLKNFRKTNKITQAKLATMLNTTQSVIANYERGRNYIATPFLYTICKTYNVSADYLLGKSPIIYF